MTDASSYSPPLWFSGPAAIIATAYAAPNNGSDAALPLTCQDRFRQTHRIGYFFILRLVCPMVMIVIGTWVEPRLEMLLLMALNTLRMAVSLHLDLSHRAFCLKLAIPAVPEPSTGIVVPAADSTGCERPRKLRKA